MLASVLNSPTAVEASVRITDTFVAMRKTLASIAPLLSRIEATERRQLKLEDSQVRNEERFKLILDAMQDKKFPPQKEIKCCQCDSTAVAAPCGGLRPIGKQTRRAKREPSSQVQFPMKEVA